MSSAVQQLDSERVKEGVAAVMSWQYQTPRSVVLPYKQDKQAIFAEDFLARLYFRFKEDGTLPLIFPGMKMDHLNTFLSYMAKVKGFVISCRKTETKPEPMGIGWLTEVDTIKASFGFGFFRSEWRNRQHIELSALMLAYWFGEFKVNCLYGTTLNPIANNYAKRFGFEHLCVLPGFFECNGVATDAHLIVLRKAVFLERHDSLTRG